MSNKIYCVYCITNTINGKRYVGVTGQTLSKRLADHYRARSAIGDALRKYGIESFFIEILETGSREDCYENEQRCIEEKNSHVRGHGYNILVGGDVVPRGARKWDAAQRERQRQKMLGNTLAAGGSSRPGPRTEEEKKKISDTKRNNPKIVSSKTRQLLSEAGRGRVHSEETKRKMSEAAKGKPRTEETRKRMSEAKLLYWANKKSLPKF